MTLIPSIVEAVDLEMYDRLMGDFQAFLATAISPEAWATFRLTLETQQEIDDLLDRNTHGGLSDSERQALERFLAVSTLLSVARAEALSGETDAPHSSATPSSRS